MYFIKGITETEMKLWSTRYIRGHLAHGGRCCAVARRSRRLRGLALKPHSVTLLVVNPFIY